MKQMIGISLGSQNVVVGVLKNGSVDIILSETSSRNVPNVVAFNERERSYADSAVSTIKSNFKRTVIYPNRWLGLQPDWPFVQEEAKHATCQPIVDTHNKIGFEIDYKGEKEIYYPEHLTGLFFNKLKQNWKKAGYDTREVVVSVPDYYTAHERKSVLDALQVADLTCTALLNESSAITLEYGLKRRAQFDEKEAKIVAFVDMGQSKTTISFASFSKNTQKVIYVASDRFLGARQFDYLLMQHFSDIFKKKYGSDPMQSVKTRLRMADFIAKARKTLTVNREVSINIDCLMEDDDLNATLSRDEFEKLIAPILVNFKTFLQNTLVAAMNEAKFQITDLLSVEMAGDAVRTPIVQEVVKEVYGMEISKHLLPDEAIARGCTFFAAMLSPYFTLKDFTFEHYNPYSIQLEYPFIKDGELQMRHHTIIKKGENIPSRKSIKFTEKQLPKQDVIQLRLFYNNEELGFLNNNLLKTYMVSIPHVKEEQWTFALQFYLDAHGIPHLDKATINEIHYEDAPVKTTTTTTTEPKKEGEQTTQPTETQPVQPEKIKKERQTLCIIKLVESLLGLPQAIIDTITQKEATQENEDKLLHNAMNKRNEFENFIYNTRPKLDTDLANYVTKEEKELLLKQMQELEDWLYSGDEGVYDRTKLEERGNELHELGTKVHKRYHDWERLNEALGQLEQLLNLNIKKLNENTPQTAFLNQQDRDELKTAIAHYNNLLLQGRALYAESVKTIEPTIRYESVEKSSEELIKKCSQILINAEKRVKDELKKKEEEEKKLRDAQAKSDVPMTDSTNQTTTQESKTNPDINMDVD